MLADNHLRGSFLVNQGRQPVINAWEILLSHVTRQRIAGLHE